MDFACDDGRWILATLDSLQQLGVRGGDDLHPGGVIVGADPSCDVVIDDDGVEDFHFRIFGRGHHDRYVEVIAGSLAWGEDTLLAGDELRGERWKLAGWREARFVAPAPAPAPDSALAAAWSIARDAELEGRATEAASILADAGLRRIRVHPRTALPARLLAAQQVLRLRVYENGMRRVHTLPTGRPITIGAALANDIVVPSAGWNRVQLVDGPQVGFEVLAGEAAECSQFAEQPQRDTVTPYRRWSRVRVGDAMLQLCRWPMRDEI